MDRFLSWTKKVSLRAAGTFGLVMIGGTSAAIATGDLADVIDWDCLLYTSPSPRDRQKSRMPSSA